MFPHVAEPNEFVGSRQEMILGGILLRRAPMIHLTWREGRVDGDAEDFSIDAFDTVQSGRTSKDNRRFSVISTICRYRT